MEADNKANKFWKWSTNSIVSNTDTKNSNNGNNTNTNNNGNNSSSNPKNSKNSSSSSSNSSNNPTTERTLHFDGVIAQNSWYDDDITPELFRSELMSGKGDVTVWLNSPGGDCIAASQIYSMLRDYQTQNHGSITSQD